MTSEGSSPQLREVLENFPNLTQGIIGRLFCSKVNKKFIYNVNSLNSEYFVITQNFIAIA